MTNTTLKAGYAPVNGLKMYYEIHGTGKPLVLLHGGLGVVGMFEQILPALAEARQVIAVECRPMGTRPTLIAHCPSSGWRTMLPL